MLDGKKIVILKTVDELSLQLRQAAAHIKVLVSLVDDIERLQEMEPVRHLLADLKTVLILPNQEQEIVSKGHSYYPNYVSYIEGDFCDVAAVLEKMIKNNNT